MGVNRYQLNFNEFFLTIGLETGKENKFQFYIHDRGGAINIDFNHYKDIINIIENLEKIDDIKQKEKHIILNEYVSFDRTFISDTLTPYDYEIRITEKKKIDV